MEPSIFARPYVPADPPAMTCIWNQVVAAGCYFPQAEPLTLPQAADFFAQQSLCAVAQAGERALGLYILHPNNIGRCGAIANASYAVSENARGQHAGRALVCDSLAQGKRLGFRILQFNAVVATNHSAIRLYKSLGFVPMATLPGAFRMDDGSWQDLIPFYHTL